MVQRVRAFLSFWDLEKIVLHQILVSGTVLWSSGIPEAETFGRNRKFSVFGIRFRPPKVKAEYGRNSRKPLDFFFPSVFQDEVLMAWFSLSFF
jgi:hypothetical protein